jgi:PAS domain S-box-containing protein
MHVKNRNKVAFVIGLLILVYVGASSYRNAQREESDRQWVAHTYQVLDTIDAADAALADMESSQRSYVLTGDSARLQGYEMRRENLSANLIELRRLTSDNPAQQRNMDALEGAITARLKQMQLDIALRQKKGLEAAAESIQRESGAELMATIRDRLSTIRAEEQQLLKERSVAAEAASRKTKRAIVFGSLLAVGFLFVSFLAVDGELRERRRAEAALHSSEERFRLAVADVTSYAILTLDPHGHVASWNAGAERIKGYRAEEILGRHFSCFYSPEDVQAGKPEMNLKIAARDGRMEEEGWRVRKDGSRFWGNVVITAMKNPQGKLIGFSKVTRDLTERKNAEERIQILNRNLEQHVANLTAANRDLDAFTYSLAHDLRAPLRHIHGFANILMQDWNEKIDDEGKRYLGKIVKSSREMGVMVDDLLNFARLGRVELQRTLVDLSQMVEEVKHQLEPDTQGRSIQWEVGQLPTVAGDPALLRQVLVNLLSNAVKYTSKEQNAQIKIGSGNGGNEITVFVRDNGAGFEMKYAEKLFRVFQRLHRAEEFEGTGVGLANVRRIIERHGGRIWAEGEPGKGATFYFSLPAKEIR